MMVCFFQRNLDFSVLELTWDSRHTVKKRVSKASLARKPVSWWVTSVNCWCRWERFLRIVLRTETGWLSRLFSCKGFSVFSNNLSSSRKRSRKVCSFLFLNLVVEIGAKKLSALMHCGLLSFVERLAESFEKELVRDNLRNKKTVRFATTAVKNTIREVNGSWMRWLNLVESLYWGTTKTDQAKSKEADKKLKRPKNGTERRFCFT